MDVDYELRGCPVDKGQLVEVLAAFLGGRKPRIPTYSVCVECKLKGNVCVPIATGQPCLGPVTQAGCGALCPSYGRGCYGCFGPQDSANTESLTRQLADLGMSDADIVRVYRTFNAGAPEFEAASNKAVEAAAGGTAGGTSGATARAVAGPCVGPGRRRVMTHQLKDGGQVLNVGMLARVEGEGGMHIEIKDREVVSVKLNIFEPPRFYEGFLRGRKYTEPPDITARICGICPVAYQSASTEAMETICGVTTTPEIQLMRRLLYCGEWIESHALHIFMLHAPDFLGFESVLEMAKDHGDVVNMALRLKKCRQRPHGTGGRPRHPPRQREGGRLLPHADASRNCEGCARTWSAASRTRSPPSQLVSTFDFPEMEQEYNYVSLRHPDWYPLERGTEIVATSGARFPVGEIAEHVKEFHVEHSNALHASFDGEKYFVGPLARYSLNFDQLSPRCQEAALRAGLGRDVPQPLQVDHRAHRGTRVRLRGGAAHHRRVARRPRAIGDRSHPRPARASAPPRPPAAPSGTATRSTPTGSSRTRRSCRPPPRTRRASRRTCGWPPQQWVDLDDHTLTHRCEAAIRNYDPCISCATHFLDLRVKRS